MIASCTRLCGYGTRLCGHAALWVRATEADPWCRPRGPGAACACDACQTCTAASWISRRGSGGVAAGDGLGGPCCEAAAPVRTEQRPGNGPGTARERRELAKGTVSAHRTGGGRVEGTAEAPQLLHPGAHASHRSRSVNTGGTYQQVQSRREFRQCCGSAAAGLVATRVCTGYGARRVTRDAARRCTSLQLHVACVTAAGARPEHVRPRSRNRGTAARHSTASRVSQAHACWAASPGRGCGDRGDAW